MKDAYWFKHDSNAKDDPKCIVLIEELGLEGYGIFWVLIETLRSQTDFKAPLRIVPALARRHNTSTEKIKAVITRYDLFTIEDEEFFFSQTLIARMKPLLDIRKKKSEAGLLGAKARWQKNGSANGSANGNKSREEKNRPEENSKVPTLSEVTAYFQSKGYGEEIAKKFYTYYNEPMVDRNGRVWKDQNGKTVKSWKQKALSVWMKDEHKQANRYGLDGIISGGQY